MKYSPVLPTCSCCVAKRYLGGREGGRADEGIEEMEEREEMEEGGEGAETPFSSF